MRPKTSHPRKQLLRDPGSFDHEDFMQLLLRQQVGTTSRKENAHIKQVLKERAEARELLAEIAETSVDANWQPMPKKRFPIYMAAGIALVVIASAGYFLLSQPRKQVWNTIAVPKGMTRTVKLEDGTVVCLNAATILRYPSSFAKAKREVHVDGEAFFTVTGNPDHPFIVHTSKADIKVLGTRFNVRTYDSSFSTALLSGAIAVTIEGQNIKVLPGYTASLIPQSGQLLVSTFSKDTVVSWLNGIYQFKGKTLGEVCRMAERIYDVTILIEDDTLSDLHYSGDIDRQQSLQILLEKLSHTVGFDYEFDGEGKLHLRK